MEPGKKVEQYINKHAEWKRELTMLRNIVLSTEMQETVKWGIPTYTINGKNVAGLGAFKSYCGIWFFQGVFLQDKHKLLVNAQEERTKAMRQMRFNSIEEIDEQIVKSYLREAIENQKQGKAIKPERKPLVIPEELKEVLSQDAGLSEAFDELHLSKRRDYAEYISEAKRAETKQKRLEKIKPMILEGIGLNDKYK